MRDSVYAALQEISQALRRDPERKVVSVAPVELENTEKRKKEITRNLKLEENFTSQIVIIASGAKDFLETVTIEKLSTYFSQAEDAF